MTKFEKGCFVLFEIVDSGLLPAISIVLGLFVGLIIAIIYTLVKS